MTTNTKTAPETNSHTATDAAEACCRTAAGTAEACCRNATDAFKAGVDANQKLFNTIANSFADTFAKGWNPMNPMNANPFTAKLGTVPAGFEQMTKAMNTLVDANARFASECNALVIDAMRANARTMEHTGSLMVNQLTGKTTKPATDAAREILDECNTFAKQMGERTTKMSTEHARQVSQVMEQVLTCKA